MMLSKAGTSAAHWSCICANQARIAAGSSPGGRGPAWPAPLEPGEGTKDVTSWSTQRTGSKEPVAPSTTMNRAVPVASPATPPLAPSCHSSGALPSLVSLNVTTWICIAGQSRTSTLVPTSRNLTRWQAPVRGREHHRVGRSRRGQEDVEQQRRPVAGLDVDQPLGPLIQAGTLI